MFRVAPGKRVVVDGLSWGQCVIGRIPFAERWVEVLGDCVHRSIGPTDATFAAHRWFIGSRLAMGGIGIVPIMLWLALPGVMPRAVLVGGAVLFFQLIVALAVSRLGGLRVGFVFSVAAFAVFPTLVGGALGPLALLPFILEGAILSGSAGALLAGILLSLDLAAEVSLGGGRLDSGPVAAAFIAIAATVWGALYWSKREAKREMVRRFSDDRWRALSGLSDIGVIRHDESGGVIGANAAFCRLMGIPPETLSDKTVITRLHLGSGPAFLKALSDVNHGANGAQALVRMKCEPDAEGHSGPDPYRDFEIRLARSVHNPVTRQAEIVACYRPLVETAADTAIMLPERPIASLEVARLGHELRTPLTAIIGFAECLGDPSIIAADDPKRGDYARIIGTSARHMLDLVNDLSNASAPVEPIDDEGGQVDLAELIGEAVGIMRLNVEAQRARLSWEVAADVPLLSGSRHAFRQILINLISNGLKFAPEGAVVVRAIREGEKIRLTVEDNGVGVSQGDLPRLGEPYFRGSAAAQDTTEGQGLGLGIVRDIVRRHQGHFDVMSRPGAGTRVIVTFLAPDAHPLPLAVDGATNHRERAYA